MIIIISSGVINNLSNTVGVLKLHRLLSFAAEGRHSIIIDSAEEVTDWLDTLDVPTRTAYSQAIALSARTIATLPKDVSVVKVVAGEQSLVWDRPVAELCADDAIRLLEEPLGILLENSTNDWCFLRRIMRSAERIKLQRAVDSRWAEPLHGGGSDITQKLKERASTEPKRLRTFVIFDSDRRHPDELHPSWAPRPPEACQGFTTESAVKNANVGGYWKLDRRFIESYLPKQELLKAIPGKELSVSAFFRLDKNGQWYFNIKKGFKEDSKVANAHRAKSLYVNVPLEDKELLEEGFGSKIANQYSSSDSVEFDWDGDARHEALLAVPQLMRLL